MSQSWANHDALPAAPATSAEHGGRGESSRLWRGRLSSLASVAALGVAAWWGHHTGWAVPKFSTLFGRQLPHESGWCEEHGVPHDLCIECDDDAKVPKFDVAWCSVHGVAQCPFEHPEVIESRPPSQLVEADRQRAARALALRPRSENNSRCKSHLRHVQFASREAEELSGVDVQPVGREPIVETISANGEVGYDETRIAHLASRVAGTVWRVRRQVGERVKKGEVLALVDSAEVGRAKADFLQALTRQRLAGVTAERIGSLAAQGAVPERQIREVAAGREEAEIRLLGARQALVNLGFAIPDDWFADLEVPEVSERLRLLDVPTEIIATLGEAAASSNLFPLRAALDGVVIARNVVEGEVVDISSPLFTLGDVSHMWLKLDVRQDDIDLVSLGAPVRFESSNASRKAPITGHVSWISTEADIRSRTVKLRVDLPNDGHLRANTFGTGRIVLREEPEAIVVPSRAIHWEGCCHVVFVRDRNYFQPGALTFYHVRKVRLGVRQDEQTEILAGLAPGEVIAVDGSNIMAAQLLRSNLGAGCDCANHH
jgi:cobalt-zinc-cadmium efflux system membrane fusion protein